MGKTWVTRALQMKHRQVNSVLHLNPAKYSQKYGTYQIIQQLSRWNMTEQARTAVHPTAAFRAAASAEKKRRLLPTASRPPPATVPTQHQPSPSSSRDITRMDGRGDGRMSHKKKLLRGSDAALQHRRSNSAASCTSLLTGAGVPSPQAHCLGQGVP